MTTVTASSGKRHVEALEVVGAGASDAQHALGIDRTTSLGDGNGLPAREVSARKRVLVHKGLGVGALEHDLAAERARARADVDELIRATHHLLIVLDDQNRVAEIAEALEDRDEAVVVARMQPDGGLVQYVERADEARTEATSRG